jgi:hypothetical protein
MCVKKSGRAMSNTPLGMTIAIFAFLRCGPATLASLRELCDPVKITAGNSFNRNDLIF